MSAHTEFDLGSLIWVKGEIDQALEKARQSLAKYASQADTAELKFAQTHLHQVRGAVEMVGLSGAARFAEELEVAAGNIERSEAGLLDAIVDATQGLAQYLESLVNGAPDLALKLYPSYRRIRQLRGEASSSGTDLFFPSLSAELPATLAASKLDAGALPNYLKGARSRFEAGLLKWIKGEKREGAQWMMQALFGVARSQSSSLQRGFWWAAAAMVEGSVDNRAKLDIDQKQLFSRLNQQLKRLSESGGKVAERLFRDVLYTVAHLDTHSVQCAAVRQAFGLMELLPAGALEDDAQKLASLQVARELKELINQIKDNWARVGGGAADRVPQVRQQIIELAKRSGTLGIKGFDQLAQGVAQLIGGMNGIPAEGQALEVATALLLLENALVVFPERSVDFPAQAEAMMARLRDGTASGPEVTLLDEVSRRAQERLLMAQVAQEMQANLVQIEQTLDDFFRDPSTRAELATTAGPIKQIRGALLMLDEHDAQQLLDACAEIVKNNQAEDYAAPAEELEFLAEAFSSLGFYIDALRREEAERLQIIAPWLQKIRGGDVVVPEAEPTEAEQIAAEFAQGPEAEGELRPSGVAETPAAAAAPAQVAAQPVSEAAVDAELLEVYLEEAVEVLENVTSHLDIVREQPNNKDALTVIRRGFHTLKGSGRMVGLNQLGEVAWSVEQVMNKWLQDDKRATPALLQLVDSTAQHFSRWVEELKTSGAAQVEASALFALAEQLKSGVEPEVAAAPVTPTAAEPVVAAIAEPAAELTLDVLPDLAPVIEAAPAQEAAPTVDILALDTEPEAALQFSTEEAPLAFSAEPEPAFEIAAPEELGLTEPEVLSLDMPVAEPAPVTEEISLDFDLDLPIEAAPVDAPAEETAAEATLSLDDVALLDLPADEPVVEAAVAEPVTDISLDFPVENEEPAEYVIGQAVISKALFGIFLDEAYRHFATLNEAYGDFSSRGEVRPEFVHAAHTLCGIANTTGFAVLGELGYAIEQVLLAYQRAAIVPEAADYDTVALGIDKIGIMLGRISLYEPPQEEPQTVALLNALANRLKDAATPPADLSLEAPAEGADAPAAIELDALDLELDLDAAVAEPAVEAVVAAPVAEAEVIELPDISPEELPDLQALDLDIGELPDLALPTEVEAPALSEPELVLDAPAELAGLDLDLTLDTEQAAADIVLEAPTAEDAELPPEAGLPMPEEVETPVAIEAIDLDLDLDIDIEHTEEDAAPLEAVSIEVAQIAEPVLEAEVVEIDAPVPLDETSAEALPPSVDEALRDAIPLAEVDEAIVLEAEEAIDVAPAAVVEPAPVVETAPAVASLAEPDGVGSVLQLTSTDRLADIHVQDELDEQLLPIFLEEMQELMPQLAGDLRALRGEPGNSDTHDSLKRVLHTLKGSARMAGAMRMGEATHNMETRLLNAGDHISTALVDELDLDFDAITELQDRLINGEPVAEEATAEAGTRAEAPSGAAVPAAAGRAAPMQQLGLSDPDAGKSSIRVRSDLVDRLVNQAGEVSISRTRIESEMLALKRSLLDLTDNVARLRGQLREIEIQAESQMQSKMSQTSDMPDFDPLEFDRFSRLQELTRFMAESVNDVATVQHNLLKNLDESSAALTQQARMTRDLQQELMRVRMVPFSSVSERLYRLVRQTGKETAKKVNLEIRGGRAEIDRGVLEKMVSPFEHMLRNAIDHGLEKPEKRLSTGKNEFGEIVVEARQEGNELVLTLRDDGAGLDLERIRQKGLEKGLIEAGTEYSDAHIMGLIFEAGFSTASAVTQLSGRGIGMDVVKSEIEDLGGRVEVDSQLGKGTIFTIHLPLTLAVTQAVLVRVAGKLFAIPSVMVEQVQELKLDPLNQLYQRHQAEWQGNIYPFHYLPRLLGDYDSQPEQKRYNTIMLLRSGVSRIAIHVDELVKNQEVVVKNIGPQLVRVAGIAGATVLGNGDIVLILNPLALLQRRAEAPVADFDAAMAASAPAPEELLQVTPLVMVVDDSLTVRKITGRLLAREGYQVETAKDGVDALQKLQDVRPAVMLLDVEMPRMDGFELTRNMRANADLRDIPIIMITSRTADKHKNFAFELGVNAFLGKPYQEDELLEHIRRLIGEEQPIS